LKSYRLFPIHFAEISSAWFKSQLYFQKSKFDYHFFFMGLLLTRMLNGRKHGQHTPPMIKKNAYAGQKNGYLTTSKVMFEFYHYLMILTLWQVSTMMWLKLARTSFKVWLKIQGVTIILIHEHIIILCVLQLSIIACIFRSCSCCAWINCSCVVLLCYTPRSLNFFNCYIHVREHEMGLGCQHFVEGPSLILVTIYYWSFLKVYFW
jgi:hypothetical protein